MDFYLIGGENNFALFLISPSDEQHVADAGCVVHDNLVLVRRQHIPKQRQRNNHLYQLWDYRKGVLASKVNWAGARKRNQRSKSACVCT
jgi:hypothetical protein